MVSRVECKWTLLFIDRNKLTCSQRYAVKVNGKLPEDIVQDLLNKGVQYRPRDGSAQD
jgi:hypothetical protein